MNMDHKGAPKTLCCDIWHSFSIHNYPRLLVSHLFSMFTNYGLHSGSNLCPKKIEMNNISNNKLYTVTH
jgi:hypothetical protein